MCVRHSMQRVFDTLMHGLSSTAAANGARAVCGELQYVWDVGRSFARWSKAAAQGSLHDVYTELNYFWSKGRVFSRWSQYLRKECNSIHAYRARRAMCERLRKKHAFARWVVWVPRDIIRHWRYSLRPPPLTSSDLLAKFGPIVYRARDAARAALHRWLCAISLVEAWVQRILRLSYWKQWYRNTITRAEALRTIAELRTRALCAIGTFASLKRATIRQWRLWARACREDGERMDGAAGIGDLRGKEAAFGAVKRACAQALTGSDRLGRARAHWAASSRRAFLMCWRFRRERLAALDRVRTLRRSSCLRRWQRRTTRNIWIADTADAAADQAQRRRMSRAWGQWMEAHAMARAAQEAARKYALHALARVTSCMARERRLVRMAVTLHRKSVLKAALRRLASGGALNETWRESTWVRRASPAAYRPFSLSGSKPDSPPASMGPFGMAGTREQTVASGRIHLARRGCLRRWLKQTRDAIELSYRVSLVCHLLCSRSFKAWNTMVSNERHSFAIQQAADTAWERFRMRLCLDLWLLETSSMHEADSVSDQTTAAT
jgi:hypothetical protein